MSDYYRDRVRHGGILSNQFIGRWFAKQIKSNQYGLPGRAAREWGEDTIDGDLPQDVLDANRRDQTVDTAQYRYRDEPYYASKEYDLGQIEVPLLSVANWVRMHNGRWDASN
jgi:predicted acyl esterase